jgi:hypothetical protein
LLESACQELAEYVSTAVGVSGITFSYDMINATVIYSSAEEDFLHLKLSSSWSRNRIRSFTLFFSSAGYP